MTDTVPSSIGQSIVRSNTAINPDLTFHESLVHMLWRSVEDWPDNPAVVCGDLSVSYRELGRATNGLANLLRKLSLGPAPIAVLMKNSIEMEVALLAVMSAGAQVAPVNPQFTQGEIRLIFETCNATAIICDATTEEAARSAADEFGVEHVVVVGAGDDSLERWTNDSTLDTIPSQMPATDDLALLIFTGGSTGKPKGVDHTHRSLMWSLIQHVSVWPIPYGKGVFLNVAPMFHIWGVLYATWVPIFSAGKLVIIPRYDPDSVIKGMVEHRVGIFAGGPAPIYFGLLANSAIDQADLSSLKYSISGGAPFPEDLHREWLERTGCPLLEGWGMSEGAPLCLNRFDGPRKVLSVGLPAPETLIEIVDLEIGSMVLPVGEVGEVRVHGPQLMKGYHGNEEETALALRDGYMYTGDIGYVDKDGFLFLVDRKKDMLLVGGFNVYPREIDEVLFNHPAIREAATVGRRDDRLGEVVVAFVVLERDVDFDETSFFAYCRERLVNYKRPVDVTFINSLPRTGTSKIDRAALRALATPGDRIA